MIISKERLKVFGACLCLCISTWILSPTQSALGILPHPEDMEVEQALKRGRNFSAQHRPPNELYWHFGSTERFEPHGFLITKIDSLAVMAAHFALRGEKPTDQDIERVRADDFLQVVITVFGNAPDFARDSYLLFKQGQQVVKPKRIRFDARAREAGQDEGTPVFRAKIVGEFSFESLKPEALSTLLVFPGAGGEIRFELDLSTIP